MTRQPSAARAAPRARTAGRATHPPSLAQSRDALADYIEAAERVGGESYPPLGLALSS
ncbi:hypothetical protein ACFV16_28255 [Streptomyces massasporeus]|uniref:hypothetical protein n=1 Tax=Streptomyces massasporeus TaxID=67324 RepID=UPI003679AFFE